MCAIVGVLWVPLFLSIATIMEDSISDAHGFERLVDRRFLKYAVAMEGFKVDVNNI